MANTDSTASKSDEIIEQPEAVVADSPSDSTRDFIINLVIIIAISAITAAGVHLLMKATLDVELAIPTLLMVDTERLAREEINALGDLVAQKKLSSEAMPERSRLFSEGLLREIKVYSDGGSLVLRSAAIIAAPPGVRDITDEIRERLLMQGLMENTSAVSQDNRGL